DLELTAAMLDSLRPHIGAAPIASLVNTHANGDHCYGNQLVADAEIIAATAAAREMEEVPPATLAARNAAPGEVGEVYRPLDGAFHGRHVHAVGGRRVELTEAVPAHTAGDVSPHMPDAGVGDTADSSVIAGTRNVWAGPLPNSSAACDLVLAMDVHIVVGGDS